MEKVDKKVLSFDLSKYDNIVEFSEDEDMFWNDLYLHMEDTYYIYNANQGLWYSIESKYHYAPIQYLIEENKTVEFWLVEDEEYSEELTEFFYNY